MRKQLAADPLCPVQPPKPKKAGWKATPFWTNHRSTFHHVTRASRPCGAERNAGSGDKLEGGCFLCGSDRGGPSGASALSARRSLDVASGTDNPRCSLSLSVRLARGGEPGVYAVQRRFVRWPRLHRRRHSTSGCSSCCCCGSGLWGSRGPDVERIVFWLHRAGNALSLLAV